MTGPEKAVLGQLLQHAAAILDIPDHLREQAEAEYRKIGRWLAAPESPIAGNDPDVYPQGSFRLGTIIRPLTDAEEYDIDSVCVLALKKTSVSQRELKQRIGDRLKAHPDYRQPGRIEEHRRCWRLRPADGFHMDILPAIPDTEGAPAAILITDKELREWQCSDPKGYADWFWRAMRTAAEREKRALSESLRAGVEDVPDWRVKTPLQRAVQLLKRHRDCYFKDDAEDKPVSVILTTLAARAYRGQDDLVDALFHLTERMPGFIEIRGEKYWVPNPVNDRENFADKWNEVPERREKFFAWMARADADFKAALQKRGLDEVGKALGRSLGPGLMAGAASRFGTSVARQREGGDLKAAAGTATLGSAGYTRVRSHTFYGVAADPVD